MKTNKFYIINLLHRFYYHENISFTLKMFNGFLLHSSLYFLEMWEKFQNCSIQKSCMYTACSKCYSKNLFYVYAVCDAIQHLFIFLLLKIKFYKRLIKTKEFKFKEPHTIDYHHHHQIHILNNQPKWWRKKFIKISKLEKFTSRNKTKI